MYFLLEQGKVTFYDCPHDVRGDVSIGMNKAVAECNDAGSIADCLG